MAAACTNFALSIQSWIWHCTRKRYLDLSKECLVSFEHIPSETQAGVPIQSPHAFHRAVRGLKVGCVTVPRVCGTGGRYHTCANGLPVRQRAGGGGRQGPPRPGVVESGLQCLHRFSAAPAAAPPGSAASCAHRQPGVRRRRRCSLLSGRDLLACLSSGSAHTPEHTELRIVQIWMMHTETLCFLGVNEHWGVRCESANVNGAPVGHARAQKACRGHDHCRCPWSQLAPA